MESPLKRAINFYLDDGVLEKLDLLAKIERRNRSQQFAILVENAFEKTSPEQKSQLLKATENNQS